jgi:hypothetical protein
MTDLSFALYIPVGPGEHEALRAADAIESVRAYNDGLRWVILVDDGAPDLAEVGRVPGGCELVVLRNPREGIGFGHTGGVYVADLVALQYAHASTAAAFVVKIDTDSLGLAPFEREVARALADRPDAGLLGVIGDSFGENRTAAFIARHRQDLEFAVSMPNDYAALTDPQRLYLRALGITTPAQYPTFLAAQGVLRRALAHGHPLGEYCQGGGYVVSRRLLDAMAAAGDFSCPARWRELDLGEDLMMALVCGAAGLRMYDVSGDGPRFAIAPGCVPLSRHELARSPYTLVHSIRGRLEHEFRRFFQERRAVTRRRSTADPLTHAHASRQRRKRTA